MAARNLLFWAGFWLGLYKDEATYYDYKKYLGPKWKPTSAKPSCICTNHQSWLDIMVHMAR